MLVKSTTPEIQTIIQAVIPGCKSKTVEVRNFRGPKNVNSYWDGGVKSMYGLYELVSGKSIGLPTSHPYFDRKPSGEACGLLELRELPPNTCLVEWSCGSIGTPTIYFREDNLPKQIGQPAQLTYEEKVVLYCTRSLKNTYGGRTDIRRRSARDDYGVSFDQWDITQKALIERGLLNKRGSITMEGRNAFPDFILKRERNDP